MGLANIETPRLILRQWRKSDRAPFAALNADPLVMEHFEGPLTRRQSDSSIDRFKEGFKEHGYGLFAIERRDDGGFIGFVGLAVPNFEAAFQPAVEIGWRIASDHWGNGFATEGARAVTEFAFGEAGLTDLVSFAVAANVNSLRVMQRIGMTHDPADNFDHPRFAPDHRLRHHVLYRISRDGWSLRSET